MKIREYILKSFWRVCIQIRIKIISQRAKKVLGDFVLNSKNGVKTPSWRIMGIKNDPHYSEQINCSGFVYLASLVQ